MVNERGQMREEFCCVGIDINVKGNVFDIKRFASEDGPGIRTLIFLKGCPLRCKWCANPESQRSAPEIMFYQNKCVGCGNCVQACPVNAINTDSRFGFVVDPEKCTFCGKCVDACYYGARELIGKEMTVADVLSVVYKDIAHYKNTGGGVTLGGGEPLAQPEFCREILKAAKSKNIHTAIETAGYAKWENIEMLLPYLDMIFYDIKCVDSKEHSEYIGVDNGIILKNLEKLNKYFVGDDLIVRVPIIPGVNSDSDSQKLIYMFVKPLKNVKRIELLPYHRLGQQKYDGLGIDYTLKDLMPIDKRSLGYLCELGKECGVQVQVGGE